MNRLALMLLFVGSISVVGCAGVAGQPSATSQPTQNAPAAAAISVSPQSVSFGSVPVGTTVSRTVTVSANAGNSNVAVSNVSISGAGFNASGVSAGQILTPAQTATLTVTFAPASAGSVAGSVTVTSNATNSPTTIALSGMGVQPVLKSVTLSWAPSTSPAIAGYNMYRSTDSDGSYEKLNSTLVTSSQYVDPTVQSGHTYYYVATAVNRGNVESTHSNEVSTTVP
jgi:hypothetical protein